METITIPKEMGYILKELLVGLQQICPGSSIKENVMNKTGRKAEARDS